MIHSLRFIEREIIIPINETTAEKRKVKILQFRECEMLMTNTPIVDKNSISEWKDVPLTVE